MCPTECALSLAVWPLCVQVSALCSKFKKEPNSYKDYVIALPRMANALYFTPACPAVTRYQIQFPGKEHMQRTVISYKVVETRDSSAEAAGACGARGAAAWGASSLTPAVGLNGSEALGARRTNRFGKRQIHPRWWRRERSARVRMLELISTR